MYVHSTGTVVTTWERRVTPIQVTDDQGNVTGVSAMEKTVSAIKTIANSNISTHFLCHSLYHAWNASRHN